MTHTPGNDGRQAGYGAPYALPAPQHHAAPASMIIGILALAMSCGYGLTLLASPVAWWLGRRALHEIDASGGRLSGRGMAQAGMITGIVGTVLLGLAVLAVLAFFVFVFRYDGQSF
jgi:hypothetical protein